MLLGLACGAPEGHRPPAPVPAGWIHYTHGLVSFDHPAQWTVATRPLGDEALDVFLSSSVGGGERCLLALHFGMEPRFPTMERMKPFAKRAFDTRIGGARARRIAPLELPGSSEGILELGGKGPLHLAHFRYADLDAPTRGAVEQVLASLRNQAPGH